MNRDRPQTLVLLPDAEMPNSRLPVLIYRAVFADRPSGSIETFDALFAANGWRGIWRDGVYDYHHFHSNAHEVLGVAAGSAEIQLGGESGKTVRIEAGDAVLLPAGTGHKRLSRSENFLVVGSYPPGQEHYDLCRTRSPEAELRISKTALPRTDPVQGANGPMLDLWR